jgi:phosphate transport system permease protein
MNNIGPFDNAGGAYHAVIGTLEQAGIATLITVPLGVLGAVYIVEYGRGLLATAIRFFVDVMTGIPSIVAGLFVLAFWVLVVTPVFNDGRPGFSGFAAALALSVLMLPTVVRSTEEMLRLVPTALREGAYALGVPQWLTIVRIVIPTALPGIVTGVMLAIARACGETAPVLLVAGGTPAINFNPVSGNQSSLSLFVFEQAGVASKYAPDRAWAAALTLVVLVLTLTVAAKLLARRNKLTH